MRIATLGALLCLGAVVLGSGLLGLAACGGREASGPPARWRHCRIEGLKNASGLAVFERELLAVAGGGDRSVYAVPVATLAHGGKAYARGLKVTVQEDAYLHGAEALSELDFQMKHLWARSVDFQAVASQSPNYAYLGDRTRRVVYFGRLYRDAAGRLARLHLSGLFLAPGALRGDANAGDWRDKGPGLSGLVAVDGRRRTEDLYVIDRGEPGDEVLRVRKVDRFGSVLGGITCAYEIEGEPALHALSWFQNEFHVLRGVATGQLLTFREPTGPRTAKVKTIRDGPAVGGVTRWTGMCHAQDGTVYLVSGGTPAVIAWRKP